MSVVAISDFTRDVIELIRAIPAGKVATYMQIAELAGKPHGARGVSWVLHSCSRKYKLPWHRVLNAQGKISFAKKSTNFREQRRRLEQEGVEFTKTADGQLNLLKYQWKKKAKAKRTKTQWITR